MNILVTGSSGWLAQDLVPRLKRAGHTVIGLDRQELDFSTFEASCRTLRAERRRDVYEIAGQCHGEGRSMRVSFTVRVDGDTLSFVRQRGFDFSPKRFRRCR